MTRTRQVQSGRPAAGPGTDESRLPDFVRPMLAQSAEPFDSARHLFEIKWGGARLNWAFQLLQEFTER